jgi:hypothetical protein
MHRPGAWDILMRLMRAALFIAALLVMAPLHFAEGRPFYVQQPTTNAPPPPAGGAAGATSPSQRTPGTASTGIIRGRVVRSDTGQPLRSAQVRVHIEGSYAVLTDENGRYEIVGLPAGRLTLAASKGGFVPMQHGQRRPFGSGRPLTLADGQVLERIDFSLPPGGVITGRIVDEAGEPIVSATVSVMRIAFSNGRRQLAGIGGAQTDDRGEFRIFGLPRGDYFVRASFETPSEVTGVRLGYAPTFYPGTPTQADAQRIAVKAGEEIGGISFALSRHRTASISGVVRNPDGSPIMAFVMARANSANALITDTDGLAVARRDGAFQVSNLPPGSYVLEARSALNPDTESGRSEVVLGGRDVTGVVIDINQGVTARGRIRFDTGTPPRGLKPDQVRLVPQSLEPGEMTTDRTPPSLRDDWSFELTVLTGRRTLSAFVLQGEWSTKSISVNGTDVTDTGIEFRNGDVEGIEIVLTQQRTDLSGRVTDGRGASVSNATVIAFPDDAGKWSPNARRVQSAQLDQDGRFRIERLRPGDYLVIAVDELEPGEEFDPELLEQYRRVATRVMLRDGETRTLNLTLTAF